jgi:hypothetical protein
MLNPGHVDMQPEASRATWRFPPTCRETLARAASGPDFRSRVQNESAARSGKTRELLRLPCRNDAKLETVARALSVHLESSGIGLWHSGVYCPRGRKCPPINKICFRTDSECFRGAHPVPSVIFEHMAGMPRLLRPAAPRAVSALCPTTANLDFKQRGTGQRNSSARSMEPRPTDTVNVPP